MQNIYSIYKDLYEAYGPQGWWPLTGHAGSNPTKTGSIRGYHVGDYSFPKNDDQRFEICLGAILTQNTAWPSVEKSLLNLKKLKCLAPEKILAMGIEKFKEAIRPSGYYNQKSCYILNFIQFFKQLGDRAPTRKELLGLLGIGPETADSILLYAFCQPEFVVDAYTRRISFAMGLIGEKAKYDDVKKLFEDALKKEIQDEKESVIVYQEYHALLVEHAKRYYNKMPYGKDCWLAANK